MTRSLPVVLTIASLALIACPKREFTPENVGNVEPNNATNSGIPTLGNIGDACAGPDECNRGLVCADDGTCQAPGNVAEGEPCYRTAECAEGLYCDSVGSVCLTAGDAGLGQSCGTTGDCAAGLVCAPSGFSGACIQPGENDLGDACEGYFDCIAGLGCVPNPLEPDAGGVCQAGVAGLPLPWPGVECAEDEPGDFRVYFEVPDGDVTEFYRLPYPNDIRLQNGHPNLDGHPSPGDGILGFDIVQRYKDAIESTQDRFGLNSWAFLRFSERANFETLASGGDNPTVRAIVLSPDHPRYGQSIGLRWQAATGGNKYICQNWVAVRPGGDWGRPMDPDTTYAVLLTTAIRSEGGVPARQDDDFAAMLATARPAGALGDAWDAYQPLRDWIADSGTDPATLAAAAVFTTGDPVAEARALTTPARAQVPTASELTVCDGATVSPCDDGLQGDEHERGCFERGEGYDEIHGKLSLPIVQEGTAPYLDGTSGGAATSVQRREDVCIGMTVPDAAMPAEGWPVIVYAHGTGGSFRSHMRDGTVDIVNSISIDGQTLQFLTIGWDQVGHGSRRNGDETPPNEVVFNYANPRAAKGNFLQGAVDTHAVLEYVTNLVIAADESPTGEEIRANPEQIYFFGHSQGGTTGPLALPWDPTAKGAILSGAGAGLALAILGKTSPVNSPEAVAAVLAECGLQGCAELATTHPVINLLQAYFDPVDPVNFGHLLAATVVEGETYPHHVFHTNGLQDTYSPNPGLDAMARALRATYILPFAGDEPIEGVPSAAAPFGGNIVHNMMSYSVLGRQYAPADYDGHFVVFRHPDARADVAEFLGTAVLSGMPEIR